MGEVNVYLLNPSVQGDSWLHLLSIPLADAQRLSHRPLKWLRFLVFAICGAEGHISMDKEGGTVDYQNTLSTQFQAGDYYYFPAGDFHFVDPCVMDDRHSAFDYITSLARGRAHLYGVDPTALTHGIRSVENGILLAANYHRKLGHGDCTILKTPNFALDTVDIPHTHDGPEPTGGSRYTLQHFAMWEDRPNPDAQFRGTGGGAQPPPQPWSLFLDFMYGATAFRKWSSGEGILNVLNDFAAAGMLARVAELKDQSSPGDDKNSESESEEDVLSEVSKAMDSILLLQHFLAGTTPREVAEKRRNAARRWSKRGKRSREQ
ncbi:hypothetical protein BOTBODRAFT_140789, partial [Botryobasidium botryosum FD-172 SS1]